MSVEPAASELSDPQVEPSSWSWTREPEQNDLVRSTATSSIWPVLGHPPASLLIALAALAAGVGAGFFLREALWRREYRSWAADT